MVFLNKMRDKYKSISQLKTGVILTYLHLLLYTLSGIFVLPLILRKLGISQYGIYSLAYSIMAYLTVLDLGFFNTAVRYFSEYRAKDDSSKSSLLAGMFVQIYSIVSLIVLAIGMLLYLRADVVFSKISPDECVVVRQCLLVVTVNVALTFPLSVFKAIAIANEKFLLQRGLEIIRLVSDTVFIIVLLLLGFGTFSLVFAAAFCNIVMLLILCLYCFIVLKIRITLFRYDVELLKKLFGFSSFMFIIAITAKLYWNSGQFILAKFSGSEALGYFSFGVQICMMYCSLCSGITSVFLPKLTKIAFKDNCSEQHSELFLRIGRLQFFLASLLLFGFLIVGRDFLYLWTGEDNTSCFVITLILMLAVFLPNIEYLGNMILEARNHLRVRALINFITAVLAVLFQWYACVLWGEVGCSVATGAAVAIGSWFLMNFYLAKYEKIAILAYLKDVGRMLLILVLPMGSLWLMFDRIIIMRLSSYSFLVKGGLFVVVFAVTAWFFLMNRNEKQMVFSVMRRRRKQGLREA